MLNPEDYPFGITNTYGRNVKVGGMELRPYRDDQYPLWERLYYRIFKRRIEDRYYLHSVGPVYTVNIAAPTEIVQARGESVD